MPPANYFLLRQAREAVKAEIAASPSILTGTRQPLIDDGLGNMVPDALGTPISFSCKCRVAQEESRVAQNDSFGAFGGGFPTGFDTNFSYFAIMTHDNFLIEGDNVEYNGKAYRVDKVAAILKFGGILRHRARLIPSGLQEVST